MVSASTLAVSQKFDPFLTIFTNIYLSLFGSSPSAAALLTEIDATDK